MAEAATPSKLRIWVMASRPRTLPAAIVPVAVGSAIAWADRAFALGPCLAALLGACLIQIGTNFANDYFDAIKGADTEERLGPTRVTQAGLVSPRSVWRATLVAFGLASLVGLYLVWVGGWPVLAIGVLSILSGLAYTGGPFPLGYNGLGDVFVFVFFGLVAVLGTYWVQAHALSPLAFWLSVPVGLLATAILAVNNLRDAPTDAKVGKRTLAVRFGPAFARYEYLALMAIAFAIPMGLVLTERLGPGAMLPLLAMPMAVRQVRAVFTRTGAALNQTLGDTGKVMMAFGFLLGLGLVLPR